MRRPSDRELRRFVFLLCKTYLANNTTHVLIPLWKCLLPPPSLPTDIYITADRRDM